MTYVDCYFCDNDKAIEQVEEVDIEYGVGEAAVIIHTEYPVISCSCCKMSYFDHIGENARHKAVTEYLERGGEKLE